jgi:von Willebrand factor type D domain
MTIALVAIVALFCGAVVTVVLVGRLPGSPAKPTHTRPVATGGAITTEDELLTSIRTDGLTPSRAELLFALDVGPLPGVSVAGIKSDGGFDGTVALLDLEAEWKGLPNAVQNAATKLVTSSHTVTGSGSPPASASTTVAPAGPARGGAPAPNAAVLARDVLTAYTEADYLQLAQIANTEEATNVSQPPISGFVIEVSDDASKSYAETTSYELLLPEVQWVPWPDGCHITVYAQKMDAIDSEDVAAIMSHEVFHCYQQRWAGSNQNAASLSAWVTEGEATWVMEQLHPSNTVVSSYWSKYAFTPTTKFNDRSYDAVGVYGHEGDLAGDQSMIWPLLLGIVTDNVGGHDSAALTLLMSSDSDRFYSTWGGSYYEDQAQSDWHMAGPGTPPSSGPTPRSVTIGSEDAQEIGLFGPYQAAQTVIDATGDILVVNLTSGYGKVHDSDYAVDKTLDTSAPLALCVKQGGCKCPDGTPGASEHTIPATSPITVGLDGGDTSLAAYAAGDSLDKYCKQPDPPPPSGGGPGGGGGGGGSGGGDVPPPPPPPGQSTGDPHLLTFDGRAYDLQAAGEFTLVKSTVDDLLVQVRQVPLPGSIPVAVNQAVAAELAGHRVTVALENGVVVARVDGVVDNLGGVTNVGSGTLERLGTDAGVGFLLEWPDGTTVRVGQLGLVGLNVTIMPAASRAGKLVGLLGNDNGQAGDDFATAAGVSLGIGPSAQTVHGQFADSWRITQAQSLFDYKPGQTTATFTNRSFPSSFVVAAHVPGAAAATQECQADGITDQYLLADCVVDASAVHDPAVVSHYAQAQVVTTVQFNIAHHLPAFTAPSAPGGGATPTPVAATPTPNLQGVLIDSGRVGGPAEEQVFTFTAQAGDILWFGAPTCDDGQLTFALIDPQGRTLDAADVSLGLSGCGMGRIAATISGTYQLVANADKQRSGSYAVPIRFERHDMVFQTSYGQSVSGSIPDMATHDVYEFTAQAGDVIHIFGSGCNIGPPNSIVGLADSSGKPVGAALDCTENSESNIPGPGTYELIVNFPNVGPFAYQFTLQK